MVELKKNKSVTRAEIEARVAAHGKAQKRDYVVMWHVHGQAQEIPAPSSEATSPPASPDAPRAPEAAQPEG